MALDWFKRLEPHSGLFAAEKIALIYNLLTSVLILFLFRVMDHPWHMLLDRAMIAALTMLLIYLYRLAPCKFSALVRVLIQLVLLSYWYPDTFEFNRFFPNLDHLFATAEQFFFGGSGIRDFISIMLIGCIVGTYSSIYTASIIVAYWHKSVNNVRERIPGEEENVGKEKPAVA